jgi:truncated hemoglobin YjbI
MKPGRRGGDLAPDKEMWAAFEGGPGLTRALTDFYDQVYADPRLAPFFRFTTKQRAIEKQFSFLKEIFTGEECYFGDRPFNAHHWMVISDDLFDYRERLMESSLRRYGLPEALIARFRRVDEVFRKQIVKASPKARRIRGEEVPFDGLEDVTLAVGSLCDGCGRPLPSGGPARYHVRTGQTYCLPCASVRESGRPEEPPSGSSRP